MLFVQSDNQTKIIHILQSKTLLCKRDYVIFCWTKKKIKIKVFIKYSIAAGSVPTFFSVLEMNMNIFVNI